MIWSRDENANDDMADNANTDEPHPTYVAALTMLSEELDPGYALDYATQWSQMLPSRVDRVRAAVTTRELVEATDAVLSLKVSSASVGAAHLSDTAAVLEEAVRCRDWAAADHLVAGLADIADRSRGDLSACLTA